MKSVIIFGSQYGSSKQYAEMLAKSLHVEYFDFQEFNTTKKYDVLIYIGALYAGGVKGLSKTLKNYSTDNYDKLLIITVGIADPKDLKNAETIRNSIYKQLPKNLNKEIELFHVRGSLDYSKLNLQHKLMMKLVYQRARKVPIEERDEETKALLATYNKKVNFIDFNSLQFIIDRYIQIVKEVSI